MEQWRNLICLGAVLLFFVALVACSVAEEPSAPEGFNGHMWLRMSQEERSSFLWGYIAGFGDGQDHTCSALKVPLKWKIEELQTCLGFYVDYPKPSDHYATLLTKFYEQYAQDKHVPVLHVLYYLREEKSLEEIHILVKGKNFP